MLGTLESSHVDNAVSAPARCVAPSFGTKCPMKRKAWI
jgi:hypothetical protein